MQDIVNAYFYIPMYFFTVSIEILVVIIIVIVFIFFQIVDETFIFATSKFPVDRAFEDQKKKKQNFLIKMIYKI